MFHNRKGQVMVLAQPTIPTTPAIPTLEFGDSLGLLGLLIAIVTYTQAASHFLREKINGIDVSNNDPDKLKDKWWLHVSLLCLTILDLLMIVLGQFFLWCIWLGTALDTLICDVWTYAFCVLLTLMALMHIPTWVAGYQWAKREFWP
jgi:hypothetical protein